MPTRTKAELVATFVVAYCVLLATAPDLAHWASSQSLIARTAPCPVNPVRTGCAHRAWPGSRPERAGRARVVRVSGSVGRPARSQVAAPTWPVSRLTFHDATQVRASLATIDRSSSAVRVEVASLRHASRVIASATSARPSRLRHTAHASKRALSR
jgi:hypothetical protein